MNKTTVRIYKNKKNPHKRLEVHNDGHYHNTVKAFMEFENGVINLLGDRKLHRWRKKDLEELLEDYEELIEEGTFKFVNQWGIEHKVSFYKSSYMKGNKIYVGYMCDDEDFDCMIPYGDVTVNLDQKMPEGNYGFLDTNNGDRNLFNLMFDKGWIKDTGRLGFSGFCVYPLVEFTEEFLNNICKSEV